MDEYGLIQIRTGFSTNSGTMYDLGIVTGITDTLNKAITAIPIPNLPTDSTYALESNTSNSYTFTFARKNPLKKLPNGTYMTYVYDDDYDKTSWKWTNAKWCDALMSLANRWQIKTDGYTMFINTKNAEDITKDTETFIPQTLMLPSSHAVNIFVQEVEIDLNCGDSEYLTGSMVVVVGGRLTEKLSEGHEDSVLFTHIDGEYEAIPRELYEKNPALRYIPIYDNLNTASCYNAYNEYNEWYFTRDTSIKVRAVKKLNGVLIQTPEYALTIGSRQGQPDPSHGGYMGLDLVSSYTMTGGLEEPFEHVSLKLSKRAFMRTYPELAGNVNMQTDKVIAIIQPGESKLQINAVGRGEYIVTECALRDNSYDMIAYCGISEIRGMKFTSNITWTDPLSMILDIIGTGLYSRYYYLPYQIISNVDVSKISVNAVRSAPIHTDEDVVKDMTLDVLGSAHDEFIPIIKGANIWTTLQICAMICNARIFFANSRAYIIDYTKLADEVPENIPSTASEDWSDERKRTAFNRLIVRSGLDMGSNPSFGWDEAMGNIQAIEMSPEDWRATLDSVELHSERTYDRLMGRVYGTVSQDAQGSTTTYNTVAVKYNVYTSLEKAVKTRTI